MLTIKILFTINSLEKKKKLFIQNTIYNNNNNNNNYKYDMYLSRNILQHEVLLTNMLKENCI